MAGISSIIGNGKIIDKTGNEVDIKTHFSGKIVGLYFSGHWCPPCRGFTPILAKFYKTHHDAKKFEIIFVSSDRNQESFDEYYAEMPWLALEFKLRSKKEELSNKYDVSGIPTLVLIDADTGNTITTEGREKVQFEDPNGRYFPWQDSNKSASKKRKCNIL